jgi:hypothetical protein
MAFQKGNKLGGRSADKPFTDALKMEIKAAGEDHRALRTIARVLMKQAEEGNLTAIRELADRLDGKPIQQIEQNTTITHASELRDDDLAAIAARGGADAVAAKTDPTKLN